MADRGRTAAPISIERGSGKRAVLLSPVLPTWDNGEYFRPLTDILSSKGYRVVVFDTLSLIPALDVSFQELAQAWDDYLANSGKIDLLGGAAMGGSVVQAILGGVSTSNLPDILLFSSPTICDDLLCGQLLTLANTATKRGATESLKLLSHLVRPIEEPDETSASTDVTAVEESSVVHRLSRGFEILSSADAATTVNEYRGRLLHLYGESSRLAMRRHIVVSSHERHRAVGLPGCGMRPLSDALTRVETEIVSYLAHAAAQ